eukprot:CFRG0719T1
MSPKRRAALPHVDTFSSLCAVLRQSTRVVVVLGAGVSTSCGIPDFRSENGLYAMVERMKFGVTALDQPESLFDAEFFAHDPLPYYTWASTMHRLMDTAQPSNAHLFLKLLEDRGQLLRVYTQNVDGLEERAGVSPGRIVYSHGSMRTYHCMDCRHKINSSDEIFQHSLSEGTVARCRQPRIPRGRSQKTRKTNVGNTMYTKDNPSHNSAYIDNLGMPSESEARVVDESEVRIKGTKPSLYSENTRKDENSLSVVTMGADVSEVESRNERGDDVANVGLNVNMNDNSSRSNQDEVFERNYTQYTKGGTPFALVETEEQLDLHGKPLTSVVQDSKIDVCASMSGAECNSSKKQTTAAFTKKSPADLLDVGVAVDRSVVNAKASINTSSKRTRWSRQCAGRQPHSDQEAQFIAQERGKGVCMGVLRPDIVFFGDDIGAGHARSLKSDGGKADFVIVMGTSLSTRPMSCMPFAFPPTVPQIWISRQPYISKPVVKLLNRASMKRTRSGAKEIVKATKEDSGLQLEFDLQVLADCDHFASVLKIVFTPPFGSNILAQAQIQSSTQAQARERTQTIASTHKLKQFPFKVEPSSGQLRAKMKNSPVQSHKSTPATVDTVSRLNGDCIGTFRIFENGDRVVRICPSV